MRRRKLTSLRNDAAAIFIILLSITLLSYHHISWVTGLTVLGYLCMYVCVDTSGYTDDEDRE